MASKCLVSRYRQHLAQVISFAPQIHELLDGHHSDVDVESYIDQQRLWCGIIDAMTPNERGDPLMVLDDSRVERIAQGSGATAEQVVVLVKLFVSSAALLETTLDVLLDGKMPPFIPNAANSMSTIRFDPELCEKTHAGMLAGTCPWCGCEIISQEQT